MKVYLILHVVHIVGTIIIESVIDVISRGYNMGGMMRSLNPLHFVLLYKGAEEISTGVEPWLRLWWGESLTNITPSDWFVQKGNSILWVPPPSAVETALELLIEERLQRTYKSHLMVVPQLMTFLWIK